MSQIKNGGLEWRSVNCKALTGSAVKRLMTLIRKIQLTAHH